MTKLNAARHEGLLGLLDLQAPGGLTPHASRLMLPADVLLNMFPAGVA
jgi:hypothetical protein